MNRGGVSQDYTRVTISGLAVRLPPRKKSTQSYSCELRIAGALSALKTFPLDVHHSLSEDPDPLATQATFYIKSDDLFQSAMLEREQKGAASLEVTVMAVCNAYVCGGTREVNLGGLRVPLVVYRSGIATHAKPVHGWKMIGSEKALSKGATRPELYICITAEPDPRHTYVFSSSVILSPQIVHVQDGHRQPVFTCVFSLGVRSGSGISGLPTTLGIPKSISSSEQGWKGWTVTIHDLSGVTVAAACISTPFVSVKGAGKVSRRNPGAWLIMRPDPDNSMQPWGKLEAWREASGGNLGCRFELLADQAVASDGTLGKVECRYSVTCKRGGEFSLHTVVPSPRMTSDYVHRGLSWEEAISNAKGSGRNMGIQAIGNSLHVFPEPGLGTSDYEESSNKQCGGTSTVGGEEEGERGSKDEGFVMKVELKRGSHVGGLAVQIGSCHLDKQGDAGVFLALAAAIELSIEACQAPSTVLKQALRQEIFF